MTPTSSEPQLRSMTCELGHLSRPDGSATFSQGDSCVMTAVYGPGEVRMNKEILDKATVEVIYKPKSGLPGCPDKAQERIIRNTCESVILAGLHPRSSISIVVQELQNSGSFLSTCINAACAALLDAGVSMKSLLAAVNCIIDQSGQITLDPTQKQEKDAKASFMFVFDSIDRNVITVSAVGKYSCEQFQTCLVTCREAALDVAQFFRETMERKMSKSV